MYLQKYQLDIDPEYNNILVEHRKKPWTKLITAGQSLKWRGRFGAGS
jgi:hypothetical protein